MEEDDEVVADDEVALEEDEEVTVDDNGKVVTEEDEVASDDEPVLEEDEEVTVDDNGKVVTEEDEVAADDEEATLEEDDEVAVDKDETKDSLEEDEEVTVDDNGKVVTEEEDEEADIDALTADENNLTEGFKSKARIIFEAAVKRRVRNTKTKLRESFNTSLREQVLKNRTNLVSKVDKYLEYVVEQWMRTNKEAAAQKDPTTQLVRVLKHKVNKLQEQLLTSETSRKAINSVTNKLRRDTIIREASKGLASTQASKLNQLVANVKFVTAQDFQKKVLVLREAYFGKSAKRNASTIKSGSAPRAAGSTVEASEIIVEGSSTDTSNLSIDMQRYISAISRVEKNNPHNR